MNTAQRRPNTLLNRFRARIRQQTTSRMNRLQRFSLPKKMLNQVRLKNVRIAGESFKYRSVKGLNRQIKKRFNNTMLSSREVKKLSLLARKNPQRMIYDIRSGQVARQDIGDPLMTGRFGGASRPATALTLRNISARSSGDMKSAEFVPNFVGVNIKVEIDMNYVFSDEPVDMGLINLTLQNVRPDQLTDDFLKKRIEEQEDHMPKTERMQFKRPPKFTSALTSQQLNLVIRQDSQVLLEAHPMNITHLYNTKIDLNDKYECCRDYVKELWTYTRKGEKKYRYEAELDTLKTTRDYYNFCVKKNIKMIAFDINGKIILANYPEKPAKMKSLIYIQYNQHIYPFNHKYLRTARTLIKNNEITDHKNLTPREVHYAAIDLLTKKEMIKDIRIAFDKIVSFVYKETLYHTNTHYDAVKELAKKLPIAPDINYYTNFVSLSNTLTPLYSLSSVSSFMPNAKIYTKGGFFYYNNEYAFSDEETICIDMVKSYTTMLFDMETLPIIDIRTTPINRNPQQEIKKDYLYFITTPISTNLLPNNNLVFGEALLLAKKHNVPFTIKYSYECMKSVGNPYKALILDIRKHAKEKDSKLILNALIGKMDTRKDIVYPTYISKVGNEEEVKGDANDLTFIDRLKHNFKDEQGFIIEDELTEKYDMPKPNKRDIKYSTDFDFVINKEGFCVENPRAIKNKKRFKKDMKKYNKAHPFYARQESETPNIKQTTFKPISIAIKDKCRIELFKMALALGLNDDEIKYAKTDSIAFKKTPHREKLIKEYLGNNLYNWRVEPVSKEDHSTYFPKQKPIRDYECDNEENELYLFNAGGGKTTIAINDIIPRLEKENKSYIVFSSQHTALDPYRENNINCSTIAHYTYKREIPVEDNIIIDEIGMIGQGELGWIHKLFLLGKTIIGLGDYNQLLPVMKMSRKGIDTNTQEFRRANHSAYNGEKWLRLLFSKFHISKVNWRNNYTPEYYESLIRGSKNYLLQEIKKECGVNYKDAKLIITYLNKTRHKFNKLKLDYLDIPYKEILPGDATAGGWSNKKNHNLIHFDPENIQPDSWVMCRCNKFKKLGIYNKTLFAVVGVKGDKIVLHITDASGVLSKKRPITLPLTNFLEMGDTDGVGAFEFAYTRTIYSIQGASVEGGIYFALEDAKFLDGRTTYTIISRNKVKLNNDALKRNGIVETPTIKKPEKIKKTMRGDFFAPRKGGHIPLAPF